MRGPFPSKCRIDKILTEGIIYRKFDAEQVKITKKAFLEKK